MSDRRGRVAVLTHGYYPRVGGIERQRADVTPRLVGRGLEAYVITRSVAGAPRREVRDGVTIVRTPIMGDSRVARRLRPLARALDAGLYTAVGLGALVRRRPDVIHTHEFLSTARLGLLAGRILRVPVIVTAHLSGPEGDAQRVTASRGGRRLLRRIRRRSDLSIAVSRQIDAELAAAGIRRRVVVANGVDVTRFRPADALSRAALRARLGIGGDPLVVFTGRLTAQKRPDVLLDAWSDVVARWPDARLLLLGDGPQAPALRDRAPSSVDLHGAVADVAPYLRAADIFVLPSDAEGMSNALLEAQSSGLPAVATDVGAARDVVADGVTGILVPAGDPRPLAVALEKLIADAELRASMGRAARERMESQFSVDRTVDGFLDAYRTVVGRSLCPQD